MAADKLARQLEGIILGRIARDQLAVALMPSVAGKVLAALQQTDLALRHVVKLVEQDAVLAARVLRNARSAAYGGGRVTTVETAVTRLGAGKLRTLLIELAARRLFVSRDRRISAALHALWDHSVAVALIARDLAAAIGHERDMDTAYLCGLLHDVGKPVVAATLLELEREMTAGRGGWLGPDTWIRVVNLAHQTVGVALAERWMLPGEVLDSVRAYGSVDAAPPATELVRLANALAKREGFYAGPVDRVSVDAIIEGACGRLGLDRAVLATVTGELRTRVAAQAA